MVQNSISINGYGISRPRESKQSQRASFPCATMRSPFSTSLPHFDGECLFTTTGGAEAGNRFDRAKKVLDALMLCELRAINPKANLPFVVHDVRRR